MSETEPFQCINHVTVAGAGQLVETLVPRRLNNTAAGGLVIDRVKLLILQFSFKQFKEYPLRPKFSILHRFIVTGEGETT